MVRVGARIFLVFPRWLQIKFKDNEQSRQLGSTRNSPLGSVTVLTDEKLILISGAFLVEAYLAHTLSSFFSEVCCRLSMTLSLPLGYISENLEPTSSGFFVESPDLILSAVCDYHAKK